jgi:hypothetical protein
MRWIALAATCIVGLSACGTEESKPAEPATEPVRAQGIVWRDEARGFTVTYPETWQRAPSRLTPFLADPLELLALGTYPLRPGGDRCAHEPVNAVEDLGPRDALLVIFERAQPYDDAGYPPRKGAPELVAGTNRACVPDANRSDAWLSFGESGRAFYALLALGADASAETRAELVAIYDSIVFEPR